MIKVDIQALFSLKNKVAIVTGASKGIGREIALIYAKAGADLALVARNREDLEKVQKEIQQLGRKVSIWPFDLMNYDETESLVKNIKDKMGRIDILVNNAGVNIAKPAEELTVNDWEQVIDLNVTSVFFLSKEVGKVMKEQKSGKIINVSSQMAFVGYYKRAAYSTSKGGITQMTKALAIEWAEYGINVNAIAPTFIETAMTEKMFEDKEFKKDVLSRIPLGKLAKIEDLYGAFIYLASDSSNMVTGHTVVVDGGWTVW